MLNIDRLQVHVDGKQVIKDFCLTMNPGEVHVLMGPNGSGKSSLVQALAGHPSYSAQGRAIAGEVDLLTLPVHERAYHGLFLAMQHPVEIPGMSVVSFLKSALNAKRKFLGLTPLDAADFLSLAKEHIKAVGLNESFLYRSLNDGFSGGEKKRCELLQILMLNPSVIIFDEIDSGLDVDALKIFQQTLQSLRDGTRCFLVITHYHHLVQELHPDKVHILSQGRLVASGTRDLASKIGDGYQQLLSELSS